MSKNEEIIIKGAREHNLKNVSISIPKNKLVVITGLSGSGKSSLAFDTLYAEGQRRYVESLSAYARQFLELQEKPDVDEIEGLSPAIAIEQKTISKNPRSTVGTITEIYDYLRLLFARIGIPHSPATGLPIKSQTASEMVREIENFPEGVKLLIMAPIVRGQKGEYRKEMLDFRKQGFSRIRIDGEVFELDNPPVIDRNKKHNIEVVVDRIVTSKDLGNRLADSIETALKISKGILMVQIVGFTVEYEEQDQNNEMEENKIFTYSELFACPVSGFQLTEVEPRIFSFNSPYGACPKCDGIGKELYFDPKLIIPNERLSLKNGAISHWDLVRNKYYMQVLEGLAKHFKFSLDESYADLPDNVREVILYGTDEKIDFIFHDGMRKHSVNQPFDGVVNLLEKQFSKVDFNDQQDELLKYKSTRKCSVCNGYRLKPESLCVKINGKHIGHVSDMNIVESQKWFNDLTNHLSNQHIEISVRVLKEIKERLGFLQNVGLEYLTLSRESGTLSGGESQRIRLASQIGSKLSGVLYVLDEPSIGLHQSDNTKLINTLKELRDLGNTVVVVEHDEETMQEADYIIDVGPGAGVHGGNIIASGSLEEIKKNPNSITGQYLSGVKCIEIPSERKKAKNGQHIKLYGATSNNLKNVDVQIPIGTFTCVTGVSGGGKSSLIIDTLYKAILKQLDNAKVIPGPYEKLEGLNLIDKVIEIDQSPIGRTPRSNPATYTGAFTPIRDWFVNLPESKARGYKPGRFSFNVKGGRCETCQGDGMIKIEMHFLPDVYVKCDSCNGHRYNRETLEVRYKNKSISDVLNMTVEEAYEFFSHSLAISEKMKALMEVGLSYISIGQSATTLSGGEAQRVKLAKELSKRSTGKTLYILDEPTTGLHIDDVNKLLKVLHALVEKGNTVLVIEHNLDVIKTADYIIDIGPGGGDKGGRLVAACTPEELISVQDSLTGMYLKPFLNKEALCE